MNDELKAAADELLRSSTQSEEYKRRMLKLLENVTASNYTDADIREVVELFDDRDEV